MVASMPTIASSRLGLGLVLSADKAALDAALGVFTATSALLASKWVGNTLVLVAKEVDKGASTSDGLDLSSWHVHPLLKVCWGMLHV